jgi:hypothetical protein
MIRYFGVYIVNNCRISQVFFAEHFDVADIKQIALYQTEPFSLTSPTSQAQRFSKISFSRKLIPNPRQLHAEQG